MRTILSSLMVLIFASQTIAQNKTYLKRVYSTDAAAKVSVLQKMAANYDIKNANVYNSKNESTYDVVIEDAGSTIKATFNKTGEIVSTNESFIDIKLPLRLSSRIIKDFPQCQFIKNYYTVEYIKNKSLKKIYNVTIKENGNRKNLKFIEKEDPNISYVAIK